jgi:hypothetical protein
MEFGKAAQNWAAFLIYLYSFGGVLQLKPMMQ